MTKTIYISIGNSDDKLTQADWSTFVQAVDDAIGSVTYYAGTARHGRWHSWAGDPWQNACWCIEVSADMAYLLNGLRAELAELAKHYRQDSVAWAEATTEFITPEGTNHA